MSIDVAGLEKSFGDVRVIADLDLHVDYIGQTGADGELTSMNGPNEAITA